MLTALLLSLAVAAATAHDGIPGFQDHKFHQRELKFGCLNTTLGYPYDEYNEENGHLRCPNSATITEYKDAADVRHRFIKHKPLKGVTKEMLHWWFSVGLPRVIEYKGQWNTWYKHWHPVDHIANPIVVAPGLAPDPLWVAGPAPGVFIMEHYRSLDAAHGGSDHEWKKGYPYFHLMMIRHPIKDILLSEKQFIVDLALPGPTGPIVISTLAHRYQDSPEGLLLTQELISGIEPYQGLNPGYILSLLGNVVATEALIAIFLGDLGNTFTRHTIEEFGALQHLLPYVWKTQGPGKFPPPLQKLWAQIG